MNAHSTRRQTLSEGQLPALAELAAQLGIDKHFHGEATFIGNSPLIRSPHHLSEASATVHLLIGMAASAIHEARGGKADSLSIDAVHALHHLHPEHYIFQSGKRVAINAEQIPANGLFRCGDGRSVMILAGPPYMKLLNGYTNFLDCGHNKASLVREIGKWDSEMLENAMTAAGLPICRAFSKEEWLQHPQGKLLGQQPVVEIEKIADGPAVPFAPFGAVDSAVPPLSDMRVVDFSHVLAGPRCARTLGEYGADVMRITAPAFGDTMAQRLGVDLGKRCAYLDLRDDADCQTMHQLAADADVFVAGFRESVMARYDLLPKTLAANSKKGIVCVTLSAYGQEGPWAGRPGFDFQGQVASGLAVAEGEPGAPRLSPTYYLNDLITGYLATAGVMAALMRRAEEGGSWHVKLSLTRSSMWVQSLGLMDKAGLQALPEKDEYPARMVTVETAFGPITELAAPLENQTVRKQTADHIEEYGTSPARW